MGQCVRHDQIKNHPWLHGFVARSESRGPADRSVRTLGASHLGRPSCPFPIGPHMRILVPRWTRPVSLWPKVAKSPTSPFQILPSPPVPKTTQGFIGWRAGVPGLNKGLVHALEIRSCKGAYAKELSWPEQGIH